jgi:hypothetical protein
VILANSIVAINALLASLSNNRQVTTGRLLFAFKIPAAAVPVDDFHGLPRRFNCPVGQ